MKTAKLTIEKLSHDGRGIAHHGNKTTFVTGALPGEQVESRLLKSYKGITDAVALSIDNPADDRIEAKCPHFLTCGGCNLQHLDTEAQLQFKQKMLQQHLKHHVDIEKTVFLPPTDTQPFHYRQKARLGVKYVHKKQKVVVGFRELINPRFIAEIDQCIVLHQQVGEHLQDIARMIETLSQPDKLAQIEVAIGDDDCVLILRHLFPLTEQDIKVLKQFEQETHFSLFLQSKGPDTIKPLNEAHPGELSYRLPDYELTMHFKPAHFTQVNQDINQKLIHTALELLDLQTDDTVLDLFSGIGNFSLPIAKTAQQVVGIEGSAAMTNYAALNAKRNQLENIQFYPFDLTQPLTNLPWLQTQYSKLLIDPPRSGAEAVCTQIKNIAPRVIVYVSCNPLTFARDAGILAQQGYQLTHAGIFNMFPNTAHVESIGRFELKQF